MYVLNKAGGKAAEELGATRFGQIVGENPLVKWLKDRVDTQQQRRNTAIKNVKDQIQGGSGKPPIGAARFSEITISEFEKSPELQAQVFDDAQSLQQRQQALADGILAKLEIKDGTAKSILKRPTRDGFAKGVIEKAQRNKYTNISQMDDMVRGRFNLTNPKDVPRVAQELQNQSQFKVKEVVAPRLDKATNLTRYPRYHIILQDTETGMTHEWQVGTEAASELYENTAGAVAPIRIPDELRASADKLGKSFNPDLHDIEYDLFQAINKNNPEIGAKYGLPNFIQDVMKASDEAGQGRMDVTNMKTLHETASNILEALVKGQGGDWVAQFFH